MDQSISTYQRDYTWPSMKTAFESDLSKKVDPCPCGTTKFEINIADSDSNGYFNWSRTGPMGRLLDPKLYPAKTGPSPENDSSRFDQPNTYLKKLEDKYPNLYETIQATPIEEVVKRVDYYRIRSTYQVDYSDPAATKLGEKSCGQPCAPGQQLSEIDCRPEAQEKRSTKEKDDKHPKERKQGTFEFPRKETKSPAWRSEYSNGIGRVGQAIMKVKVHHASHRPVQAWVTP